MTAADRLVVWVRPGRLRWQVTGRNELVINNPAFARAVWETFFGRNCIDERIKAALVSRLSRPAGAAAATGSGAP